ncbi:MAG TPA: TetR/AcrR family transcriptional regulator [Acidimicrobiia bacterium]|nr:TetR/AcrR family transcriptional regulator [Acidimicrobiia bacterium]
MAATAPSPLRLQRVGLAYPDSDRGEGLSSIRQARRATGHRARKGEGALLREEILDATEELLYAHGSIEAVPIRAIADRVGVTSPAIYLHFADKDQLFYAVCRRGFDRFAQQLAPVLTSEGTALARIRRLGEEYIRFGLDNWQQYPILFGPKSTGSIPEDELADDPGLRVLEGLVALVAEAQAAGDFRSDLPPVTLAGVMWSAAHGTVELLIKARAHPEIVPFPPVEELIEAMLETLLRGLAAPPSSR